MEKLANHIPPRLVYFHMPLPKTVLSAYSHQNYAVQICHYFSWGAEELLLKHEDDKLVLTIVLVENLHIQ
jgi:hypothetical protein